MPVNKAFINEFEKLAISREALKTIGQIGAMTLGGGALGALPTIKRKYEGEEGSVRRSLAEIGTGALLGTALGVAPKVWKNIQAKKELAGLPKTSISTVWEPITNKKLVSPFETIPNKSEKAINAISDDRLFGFLSKAKKHMDQSAKILENKIKDYEQAGIKLNFKAARENIKEIPQRYFESLKSHEMINKPEFDELTERMNSILRGSHINVRE